ncbi:MAG: hypothetical protein HY077_16430 [Elusimicrobia bacterium]|nr:hypothetical protein [Elusimicrobiota bacterium]
MIRYKLSKPPYTKESLRLSALSVGDRAEVFLDEGKDHFIVELKPVGKIKESELKVLAGEFLNEALTCLYRQELIRFAPELSQATAAQFLEKGFPATPPDPLEQLEPQVRIDRNRDTEELLAAARNLIR